MTWGKVNRVDSSDVNVSKYIFTNDNAVAEAVLYKYKSYDERTVICCSTQSGCPVGCRFCGAGNYFVRSLTANEIVEQVNYMLDNPPTGEAIKAEQIKRFQIMFMSMGEPLLNYKELEKAIEQLYLLYPKAALLISTSAPKVDYQPLINLSQEIPTIGLQFSVHESTDEKRNALVPFKAKLSLSEIAETGVKWAMATGRQPFFNYCAKPENTSDEDAKRLLSLFNPSIWQCTISVVCESDEGVAAANERQRTLATDFQFKMASNGFSTRTFDPAGQDDIGGGCGQLWFVQDWMKKNPEKARPSIGFGKTIVHTPA